VDPCDPNPCTDQHRTICVALGDSHRCDCDPGYQDNDGDETCLETCSTAVSEGLVDCDLSDCDDSSGVATCPGCNHDGTCDPGEDFQNCPDDCPPDQFGTPSIDGIITEDSADWSAAHHIGTNTEPTDWGDNLMTDLYLAYDDDNLYVGVRGFVEANNALCVYVDTDYGPSSLGLSSIATATDNSGALDAALSADIDIADPDFGADSAVGTKGMSSASGMSDQAGWRHIGIRPDDFSWLMGELVAGSDAFEASIPWSTLTSGLPPEGQTIAVFVRLTGPDGQNLANQTLPEDDPDQPGMVSVVASFTINAHGDCNHDGVCDPGESPASCPDDCPGGQCGDPDEFQWEDAIMYFVMVDRFFDGDAANNEPVPGVPDLAAQYQGGDWVGVQAKLGYLKDLGVNAIWLSAPFDNRDSAGAAIDPGADPHMYSGYHGYWPKPADIDYSDPFAPNPVPLVESRLGTDTELQGLIDAAHALGIYVLFDYVMNHVDLESGLYLAHPDWFVHEGDSFMLCHPGMWNDPYWGTRCAFTDYLPPFDFYNPVVRQWSVTDALWWAWYFDVDGFRLDAIKHVPLDWLTELRTTLSSNFPQPAGGRFYMVGETFEYDDRDKIKEFINPATMLDGQFDFPLKKRLCEAVLSRSMDLGAFFTWMDGNDSFYSADTVMTTWIGNHDIPRAIHFASGQIGNCTEGSSPATGWNPGNYQQPADAEAYQRLTLAFGVLMTSPGIPLVYYGDEIGLAGGGDPDNRRMMAFSNLNQHQLAMLSLMQKLGRIRAQNVALRRGHRQALTGGSDTYSYKMTGCGADQEIFVLINRSDATTAVSGLPSGEFTELIGNTTLTGGAAVDVPARSLLIAKRK
jgi:glycosidase